jgi:subtilisin family serine protease
MLNMKHTNSKAVLIYAFLFCAGFIPAVPGQAASGVAPDHIIVKFKPSVAGGLKAATKNEKLEELRNALSLPPGAMLDEPVVNHLLREHRVAAPDAPPATVNLDRFLYLRVPPGLPVDECVRRVQRHPWVEYAEPDGVGTGGSVPNDPSFSSQWHHRNLAKPPASIQTTLAWDITQGSTNVIVAILDTGLSSSAEFTGRLVTGYNFAYTNSNTTDDQGHGTAVAGTVAANANNSTLVAGVDWRCRLMPVKVLDSGNYGLYSWWAQGIDYAVGNGAKVINLSAGGSGSSTTLTRAITNAIAHGVIFVTITHNDGTGVITYPGNLTNCITAGATDAQDRRTSFSNYGPQIDLCAPGTNIYTVSRTGTLQYWWGTSFSAPQVAGVCALLASLRPTISHDEARLLLCAGADDGVGDATDTPGFDNYHGWGRLNAYSSLLLAQTRVDRAGWSNGLFQLSWSSPPNASNKQPYQVEFKSALTDSWTVSTGAAAFAYSTNRTFWSDTNLTSNARYYRVGLRTLP